MIFIFILPDDGLWKKFENGEVEMMKTESKDSNHCFYVYVQSMGTLDSVAYFDMSF